MNLKYIGGVVVLIVVALVLWAWIARMPVSPNATVPEATGVKDGTYTIDGQRVTLVNGRAESASAPGSASKIVTQYFGNEATGDLNGDGETDFAFLLTQTTGGSGTFYYVAAALKTADGYQGTNAVLLGDRIAPQPTQIEYGEVVVNYAERAVGEPMTTQPSVGVSKYLYLKNGALTEIPPAMYAAGNLLIGIDSNATLGARLIGSNGKSLYVFAKDTPAGLTECVYMCEENWPPYIVATTSALKNVQAGVTGPVGVFVRSDKTLQVTYKGVPLYYSRLDLKPGTALGHGQSGLWSVAKP